MMPQLQVFFVVMPASIWVGLILVAILLAMMMGWYLTHFQSELQMFRGR
jgi:flagellar biosynthetic protein FliR